MLKRLVVMSVSLAALLGVPTASRATSPPITMTINPVAHFGVDKSWIVVRTTVTCDPGSDFVAANVTVDQIHGSHFVQGSGGTNDPLICDTTPHHLRFLLQGFSCSSKGVCVFWHKGTATLTGIVQWEIFANDNLYSKDIGPETLTIG